MSLSFAIAIIVLADLALLGLLAHVMSRAKLLTPHVSAGEALATTPSAAPSTRHARPATRTRSAVLSAQA
jgi:hypothetical protein